MHFAKYDNEYIASTPVGIITIKPFGFNAWQCVGPCFASKSASLEDAKIKARKLLIEKARVILAEYQEYEDEESLSTQQEE